MIRETTNADLQERGIAGKAQRVFVQRWLELLHALTLDTYAARLLNAHGALSELVTVIQAVLGREIEHSHLSDVWAEARAKAVVDQVLGEKAPSIRSALAKVLTNYPKPSETGLLKRALAELEPLAERVSQGYLGWTVELLEQAFKDDDAQNAEYLAEQLASELLTRRHPNSLFLFGTYLQNGADPLEQRWAWFRGVAYGHSQSMQVFVPLFGDVSLLQAHCDRFGLSLVGVNEFVARGVFKKQMALPDYFAIISVESEDIRNAAIRGLESYTQITNVIGLFSPLPVTEPSWAIVEYSTNKGRRAEVVYRKITNWPDVDGDLETILEVMDSRAFSGEDKDRILAAVQYYQLRTKAPSIGTRFINSWVALEALVRQSGSVIGDLKRYVPPLLCSRYVYRLLSNFLDDCQRCNVKPKAQFDLDLSPGRRQEAVRRLLRVLRDPKERESLFGLCSSHDLLELRARHLAGQLKNGATVAVLLSNHATQVGWHLQRIYRLRNAIVHSGETLPFVVPCMRHLEEYVRTVLLEVIARLLRGEGRTISDIMGMLYHNHLVTVDELKATDYYDPELVLRGALFR